MGKQIDGHSAIVEGASMGKLAESHLFAFAGRRDVIKALYFDGAGFAMWQKRLEKGKFPWPRKHTDAVVKMITQQFSWLLDGYDVWRMRPFEEINFSQVC